MFLCMNVVYYDVYVVDQVVKLFWYQVELFEYFRQFQDFFLSGSVIVIFCFDGVMCYNVLSVQFCKFFVSQFWVDVVVIIGVVVIVIFFVFIFVIVQIFLGKFRIDVSGGRCQIFFCVWVNKVGDQIGQMCFFCFNMIVLFQQIGDCFWIFSNGVLNLVDFVFNMFSDVNFVFVG